MKFIDLNLSPEMLKTLEEIKYTVPSEIQSKVIPAALAKKDIIGQAHTGTGKTAAFGIPVIEMTEENKELQHIILAPARELAVQIYEELQRLAKGKNIRIISIIGGVSYTIQERDLRHKPNIIVATPGRFLDNFKKDLINTKSVKTLTLDEADEMLNFGFYQDIMTIYKSLPEEVQTLFLTATFNKKTKELAQSITKDPFEVKVSEGLTTNDRVEQKFIVVKEKDKLEVLVKLLQMINPTAAIIFGRTKRRVDELTEALNQLGFKVVGIQGDMSQRERSNAMSRFRDGKINILIGTDVMARGIDVEAVDYVFNFDLPTEIEYYTHRIGRTGRNGRKGTSVSFLKEAEMKYFDEIMKATGSNPEEWPIPSEGDLEEFKNKEIEMSMRNLLIGFTPKQEEIGLKIASVYSKEELGIIVAKLLIKKNVIDTATVSLTPEQGMIDKKGGSRSRSRSSKSGGSKSFSSNKSRSFSHDKKSFSDKGKSNGDKKRSYHNKF